MRLWLSHPSTRSSHLHNHGRRDLIVDGRHPEVEHLIILGHHRVHLDARLANEAGPLDRDGRIDRRLVRAVERVQVARVEDLDLDEVLAVRAAAGQAEVGE